jgi:hypothetical protein
MSLTTQRYQQSSRRTSTALFHQAKMIEARIALCERQYLAANQVDSNKV